MEWQQIMGFWHLAQTGSFTRAAEATFRTQSALSQQIKALEAELGCQLLERIGKKQVKLTAAGEAFLAFAARIRQDYEELQDRLALIQKRPGGRLGLAAPFTTLYNLLPEVIKDYRQRYPWVQLAILDRPQDRIIQAVRTGEVDFGFALEAAVPRDLANRRWQRVQTVLMVPPDHPLALAAKLTWEEIARYPLILPPISGQSSHRQALDEHLRQLACPHQVVMESANVELSYLYAAQGLGIAFASVVKGFAPQQRRQLALLPLDDFFPPEWLVVVWRRQHNLVGHKAAFLELVSHEGTDSPN